MKVILSCEHAGNSIPKKYQPHFEGKTEVLSSHRGYDPGAFDLFQSLEGLADFSISQNVSRLLVEMNRSLDNPQLFSEFSEGLTLEEKKEILDEYYFPYRNSAEKKDSTVYPKRAKSAAFFVTQFHT